MSTHGPMLGKLDVPGFEAHQHLSLQNRKHQQRPHADWLCYIIRGQNEAAAQSSRHKEKRKLAPTCGLPTSRAPPPNGMEKKTGTRPWSHPFGTDKRGARRSPSHLLKLPCLPKKKGRRRENRSHQASTTNLEQIHNLCRILAINLFQF